MKGAETEDGERMEKVGEANTRGKDGVAMDGHALGCHDCCARQARPSRATIFVLPASRHLDRPTTHPRQGNALFPKHESSPCALLSEPAVSSAVPLVGGLRDERDIDTLAVVLHIVA